MISRNQGPAAYRESDDKVALVGFGAVGAFGDGMQSLFDALWKSPNLVSIDDEWKVPVARANKILSKIKVPANPRSSTTIKAAVFAVEQSLTSNRLAIEQLPHRCALICGVTHGALRSVEKFIGGIFDEGLQYGSATHFPMTTMNAAGGQVSIAFGIKGFNTTFCGSVAALAYAHAIVRDGRQDRAVTFGSDELSALVMRAVSDIGLLATQAITPFSGTPGINPGEGAGALLLERLSIALDRGAHVAAILSGFGFAQDGLLDAVRPDGVGLSRAIRQALKMSSISAEDIGALVFPGMGPRELLLAEAAALETVFGSSIPTRVSAVTATGMAPSALLPIHVILAAEILRRREAPPISNTTSVRPLPDIRHVLVLHSSSSGEYAAIVVSSPEIF